MIGLAPPMPLATPTPPADWDPQQPASAPLPAVQQPPGPGALRKTMIGLAPLGPMTQIPAPVIPETEVKVSSGYPSPPPPPEPSKGRLPGAGGTMPLVAPFQKTMMGIALPGIAPLNPTEPKPAVVAAESPAPASTARREPSSRALANQTHMIQLDQTIMAQMPRQGIPASAAVAIIGAGGLFAAAAVVWLFYHGQGPIEAHASAQAEGSEQLELHCAACEEGTTVRLDAASTSFKLQHATIALSRPLKVGENPMTLALTSPRGKQSFVDISVPVAFRVRGDTSGLDAARPELRVIVSALDGSTVTVDGKPLLLNAQGEGRYVIDVSPELTGLDPAVKPLERRVPYVVSPPNRSAQHGVVILQAGITPLVIDAPGPTVLLDSSNFILAGRTAKSGTLTVSDRPIMVDPSGRFAQMMNVSAPGETTITIRATTQDTAPRLFPLRVKRVDSLLREAEHFRQRATSSYAEIADQTDAKRGLAVALDGSAVEARTENYNTVLVMDVSGGCPHAPCLARITYGAPFSVSHGEKLSAFGAVAGVVDGPRSGTRIPEIHADFLLKAEK